MTSTSDGLVRAAVRAEPSFFPNDTEAVWTLEERRHVYIAADEERAGGGLVTLFVEDLEARVAGIAARGIEPAVDETYSNGVRKVTYHDEDGNEIGFGGRPKRRRVRAMARTHYFPADQVHFTWDEGNEPVITVESGDTVVVHTRDVSDNQITPESTKADIDRLDWDRVYPLAGPIAVDGAEPGDTLAVEVLDIHTEGWGWTAILPGLGLLADDFPNAYLRVFDISGGQFARIESAAIPLDPFLGTMGVCPEGAEAQPVMPPGTFGGNMDTRQLNQGTTLFLPVQVPGALFSTGDAHGCQGDGEVCVTGLEAPMYASLRFTLEKGRSIPAPQYRTAGRPSPVGPLYGTTGVGGDLYAAAQDAVRAMVEHVSGTYGLSPGGRLPAREPVRRPADLGDRRRRPVHRQRAAAGDGVHGRLPG